MQRHLGEKAFAATGLEANSLSAAMATAKAENKLVLADLSAVWCPSCRTLDREVLSNETVKAAIDAKYVFTRIEYDSQDGQSFMETYNVRGFPTLLVIDANGKMLRKLATSANPQAFADQL